jgi:anti-sigma B factor antagonist
MGPEPVEDAPPALGGTLGRAVSRDALEELELGLAAGRAVAPFRAVAHVVMLNEWDHVSNGSGSLHGVYPWRRLFVRFQARRGAAQVLPGATRRRGSLARGAARLDGGARGRYARAVTGEALAIEVSRRVGESVVVCRGDLDVVTCDRLEDAIEACLETERRALVLDLEGVEFMESRGLRCLVRAVRRSRTLGVALRILPSTAIRRVFELTALPIPDGRDATAGDYR